MLGQVRLKRAIAHPTPVHEMRWPTDWMMEYHVGWPLPCLWGSERKQTRGTDMIQVLPPDHIARIWPRGALVTSQRHLD
jgi:hypothetical protein